VTGLLERLEQRIRHRNRRERERVTIDRCRHNLEARRCKRTRQRGLLHDDDVNIVLCCGAHAPRLFEMRRKRGCAQAAARAPRWRLTGVHPPPACAAA
jgi:hypothetical protein